MSLTAKIVARHKEDPKQLSNVTWSNFTDWLNKNKIGYDMQFSSWH